MPRYTISRGWLRVDNINVQAKTEEEALDAARNAPDSDWKECDYREGINYQVEHVTRGPVK